MSTCCCSEYKNLINWIKTRCRTLDEAIKIITGFKNCPYCKKDILYSLKSNYTGLFCTKLNKGGSND